MVGQAARVAQWLDAAAAFVALLWYLRQWRQNRVRWEVIYVASMSTVITLVKIFAFGMSPFYFEDTRGADVVVWIRYAGWLITCPVLLIHLSNLAGEDLYDGYRMLRLLLSNQIMLVCAATGAMSTGDERYIFFLTGICCCSVVFGSAAGIFWEAYNSFPLKARPFVQAMAGIFYPSWVAYALLWLFGDTGLGLWSQDACIIGHALADIGSKTVWGFLGWWLRWHVLRKAGKLVGSVEVQLEDASLGALEISSATAAKVNAIPTDAAVVGGAHGKEQHGGPAFKLRRGSMMLNRRPSILMSPLNDGLLVNVTAEVNALVQAALYNLEDTSTEATMTAALRLRAALQAKTANKLEGKSDGARMSADQEPKAPPPHVDIFGPTTDEASRRHARRVSLSRSFMSDGSQFSQLAIEEEEQEEEEGGEGGEAPAEFYTAVPRMLSAPVHGSAPTRLQPLASSFCAPTAAVAAAAATADDDQWRNNLRLEVERLEALLRSKIAQVATGAPEPEPQPRSSHIPWRPWDSASRKSLETPGDNRV